MYHENTKTMRSAAKYYAMCDATSLHDCYTRPSESKHHAFERCKAIANRYDGQGIKILSFNTFRFTVGFYGDINGRKAFFYITPSHDRYIYVDEL